MNASFRHLAFRLWGSAMAGGWLALIVLPWFQGALNPHWLPLAVLLVITGCFVGIGKLMNAAGLRFLHRQAREAAVWEHAGMDVEADTAYDRVLGQYDSFWLSPFQRKQQAPWLAGRLARFYLGRSTRTPQARAWVADYLNQFPQDEALAELWLEQLPAIRGPQPRRTGGSRPGWQRPAPQQSHPAASDEVLSRLRPH